MVILLLYYFFPENVFFEKEYVKSELAADEISTW